MLRCYRYRNSGYFSEATRVHRRLVQLRSMALGLDALNAAGYVDG
jgi:hypothetical protein